MVVVDEVVVVEEKRDVLFSPLGVVEEEEWDVPLSSLGVVEEEQEVVVEQEQDVQKNFL